MYVAIEGCSHGELDVIYSSLMQAQQNANIKVDLLICCGDFQSIRNPADLKCMAVPNKYMKMQSFYKYYSGENMAPVLTIFIGGNHEASNYLQELPYGGWVAPNIYYLGYGGVINIGGLRIGGISGIYKGPDYLKGRYEKAPYSDDSIRSVYHVRNIEVFRMKQLDQTTPIDIFLSHDWPRGVTKYGDAEKLCRQKKFFRAEVESDTLGSRAAQELLHHVKPRFWFAGHLHVKFAAVVAHQEGDVDGTNNGQVDVDKITRHTRFLALDKCLPRREFLQILDIKAGRRHKFQNGVMNKANIETNKNGNKSVRDYCYYDVYNKDGDVQLYHDLEWLTVLRLTNHLQKVTRNPVYMPGPGGTERYEFTPSEADLLETLRLMDHDLSINRDQFTTTAPAYDPIEDDWKINNIGCVMQPNAVLHPYTVKFCEALKLDDPVATLSGTSWNKKGSNDSRFETPKRGPSATEMNVTLETSQLCSTPYEVSIKDSDVTTTPRRPAAAFADGSGDIVFEVSINKASDGSCEGLLTEASASLPRKTTARKALLLSTPRHQPHKDALPASPPSSVSTGDEGGSSLPTSGEKTTRDENSTFNDDLVSETKKVSLLVSSTLSTKSPSSDEEKSNSNGDCSNVLLPSGTDDAHTAAINTNSQDQSPKRSLTETEGVTSQVTAVTAALSSSSTSQTRPTKIRRRNMALYCVQKEDE